MLLFSQKFLKTPERTGNPRKSRNKTKETLKV
jgi:hypothetical protein